ncbi:hypothetical protein DF107_18025 [Burkholderia stagnalis]|uniref:hypothetical protein n=1 Tax=Burkholderia stagnalis TaxID=1503054 RepID=UPI000F5B63FD|nr:hypothetical protein [Burkholderia stagnalis]RQQ19703.1 hypothetical protein DF161_06955 [Burkholderia stagnalis]RQY67251.1 hypothetical protein DF109_07840 [Burkholderia stagnalis]RQY80016.1 hypothetical protein DF107_18025 [Burkholderia stagnalis]
MVGEGTDDSVQSNVISLEAFKRKAAERRHARVYMAEDAAGDVEFRMEGVTALNALPFVQLMLHLSGRMLKIYMG